MRLTLLAILLPVFHAAYISAREASDYFTHEVWPKVGERSCLKCHNATGEAEDSRFILVDPYRQPPDMRARAESKNLAAFIRFARMQKKDASLLLQKATGGLDHEGKTVVKPESIDHEILVAWAAHVTDNTPLPKRTDTYEPPSFFQNVDMLSDQRLLRRITLSLGARLPTPAETKRVDKNGLGGVMTALDHLMEEDSFYARLSEGFQDILLTDGQDQVPERIFGYRNFGNTRMWHQGVDFEHIEDSSTRQKAKYKLIDDYRESILREPYELIEYIVRNNRPFTEIVTADYLLVSPYTAKGYGLFDDIKDQFKNPEDHLEFVVAKLPQLNKRDGKPDQVTPTGLFPHAGMLTTFHYLDRYPTTDTNRNRLRVRKFYEHFLGVDILALAPRVTDAAATDTAYDNPVMQAPDCVVCHRLVDPVAGLFQDYQETNSDFGPYGPLKEGWFKDVFPPGFEGQTLPEEERWRALQWLGERTVEDPRFAIAMVEHVYYFLTGRRPLVAPEDINDPTFNARRRAFRAQRQVIEQVAQSFRDSDHNLKIVFKELVRTPFYRADALTTAKYHPQRIAELDDVGVVHLLTPEQLERKITALFERPWTRFSKQMKMLYGGIDYKEVTERLADPSGAMGAIQRIMANEVACKNVPYDFARPPDERRLFPGVEPGMIPGESEETDLALRQGVAHLHRYLLGREDGPHDAEVEQTYQLFCDILHEAHTQKTYPKVDIYFCKAGEQEGPRTEDPLYTVRAWRAVLTYLLRQREFLYE